MELQLGVTTWNDSWGDHESPNPVAGAREEEGSFTRKLKAQEGKVAHLIRHAAGLIQARMHRAQQNIVPSVAKKSEVSMGESYLKATLQMPESEFYVTVESVESEIISNRISILL